MRDKEPWETNGFRFKLHDGHEIINAINFRCKQSFANQAGRVQLNTAADSLSPPERGEGWARDLNL